MQTLESRNRFAKTKNLFAKKKQKFIFKKIGDKIGDGSGATLSDIAKQRQPCPPSPRVVLGILRNRAGNPPKIGENYQKRVGNAEKKC